MYIIYYILYIGEGNVYSTGGNSFGQLGLGHKKSMVIPCLIEGFPTNTQMRGIATGHHSACISTSGEVYIWGTGVFGEYLTPHLIKEISRSVRKISIGGCFGAALDEEGALWTWGSNTSGELGIYIYIYIYIYRSWRLSTSRDSCQHSVFAP